MVVDRKLPTFGLKLTIVAVGRFCSKCYRQAFTSDNHVFGLTIVPIEAYTKLIFKETKVNTEIESFNTLPANVGIN